jgi:hypothetical protein
VKLVPGAAQSGSTPGTLVNLLQTGTSDALRIAQTDYGNLLRLRAIGSITGSPSLPIHDVARLTSDGAFVILGSLGIGIAPHSGAGVRFMWHASKAALRAGEASGTQFDDSNVGFYSWAAGLDSRASGLASVVTGQNSQATGTTAFAHGNAVGACGTGAIALGRNVSTDPAATTASPCTANIVGAGSFIFGDGSSSAYFTSVANEFAVRASGGVRLRTNSAATVGCDLSAGGNTWNCTSDRNAKENFAALDGETVLQKVAGMPIETWTLKTERGVRHVGPMAQDFYAAFGFGTSDKTIGLLDEAGLTLKAVQALERRTRVLQEQLDAKTSEVESLRARLERLEKAIESRD